MAQKKIDDDKLNHEDVVVTKISLQDVAQQDLSKVIQTGVEQLTTSIKKNEQVKVIKREQELPWRITPSQDLNRRLKHYLMLSKIRLTCKKHLHL